MVGTAGEVTPITQIDHVKVGDGACGSTTMEMQRTFFRAATGEEDTHSDWLTPI
jgi:branched-chain amino acid aminotransferase